jgi:hypothetical protein
MTEGRVKGLAYHSVQRALSEMRGPEFVARVREAMPGPGGDELRSGAIVANGWYPTAWYRAFYKTIVDLSGDPDFARECGRVSVRYDITIVHRMLFRVLSPETLTRQGAKLFKMYFDPAELDIVPRSKGVFLLRFYGCAGFDRNLWLDQWGGTEELVRYCGGAGAVIRHLSGGGDREDAMELECRY